MKNLICLLVVFLFQFSFGQTEKHIKVEGTKCSLIPPDGFEKVNNFSGFQHTETGSSIMVTELPAPYQMLVESFTPEALKGKGMNLISKNEINFKQSKAMMYYVSQSASGTTYLKQILMFGDDKKTIMINGIYPEASKSIEEKIKESLLSTIYDESQSENPLEAVSFSIDVSGTEFKLIKYLSGSLLYSTDGKIPTEKPTLIVGNSISKTLPEDQQKFAEERLKKLPGADEAAIRNINPISVDGMNGYEIVADSQKDNTPQQIYQSMLFDNEGSYYIIVGQTKENFGHYLKQYQKITKTFKRK